jgi:hypothetical protein
MFVVVAGAITAVSLTKTPKNIDESRAAISSPITFATSNVSFSADIFSLVINNRIFKGIPDLVKAQRNSDPGTPTYTTLETEWTEGQTPMRMNMYFASDGHYWWISSIRTYDGSVFGNWIFYTHGAPYLKTLIDDEFVGTVHLKSDDGRGDLTLTNLHLKPFRALSPFWGQYNLVPSYQTTVEIPVSGLNSGYAFTQVLYDANRNLIPNQSDFTFQWRSSDTGILKIQSQSNLCIPGMIQPCPTNNHIETTSLRAGETSLVLDVFRKSTGLRVNGNVWNIIVPPQTPGSPSNASFGQEFAKNHASTTVSLQWEDNSSDEQSFLVDFYISGYIQNRIQTPADKIFIYTAVIPCSSNEYTVPARAAIYAKNANGYSRPTFADGRIVVPKCQNSSPTPSGGPLLGDANGDRKVDGVDFVIWLNHYNQVTNQAFRDGDFNTDGKVDGIDFTIWLNNYGK